jgi:ABC-type nitrate/sulfonate/bicarbonate transport system substrate-binding protein
LRLLDDPLSIIGAYQSVGGFVRRDWAGAHTQTLVTYLAGYIEGVRWVMDPANFAAGSVLLAHEMKLAPDMADACMKALTQTPRGLAKDAAFDIAGMETVLSLRAQFVHGDGATPAPVSRYYDATYYDAALAALAKTRH